VEGTIKHPNAGEAWEYSIVVSIHGSEGKEISRQIVSVGALNPEEQRTFRVAVDVFTPSSEEAAARERQEGTARV
jgi:hypothetical protein